MFRCFLVRRIGKTLLIDDFDLSSYLMRAEQKQWQWLRNFLSNVLAKRQKLIVPKKNATRDNLQRLSMLNKFLHYSIAEFDESSKSESDLTTFDTLDTSRDLTCLAEPIRRQNLSSALELTSDDFERQLNRMDSYYTANDNAAGSTYLRNLLWKFEDINMLVGSDMPIFGDASHPAVSLRLSDMARPINVLTGLDYWLDNLMCSVPEVLMCYHLDGIVQKYELLKTEDIPHMTQFNTGAVRNIAQNILTFLKSKATKSGHTYWLFKGKHDDVVKLYDLTSLCDDQDQEFDENSRNPYLMPVAMLLYR